MPRPRIRVLVPSTERKRTGGSRAYTYAEAQEDRAFNRFSSLVSARTEALGAFLSAINGHGHAAEVLRLAEPVLTRVTERNLAFPRGALLPVHEREEGPFFSAFLEGADATKLLRRAREDLLIVCPLLGLLSPTDLVPEYRCPVGAQIPEWKWGSMHAYWKPHLTAALDRLCKGRRVFTFLSGRLQALWQDGGKSLDLVQISFVRTKEDGKQLAESAGSGRLAGELTRFIFERAVTEREQLFGWRSSAGHVYDAKASELAETEARLVFSRET